MWFVEFLRDKRQAVNVDGHKSSFKENIYGVPQGSVIGPFLFHIYVRGFIKQMEIQVLRSMGMQMTIKVYFHSKLTFKWL